MVGLQRRCEDPTTHLPTKDLGRYCAGRDIEFTRSRAYRKDIQAWIEQKNGSVIRRLVDHERYLQVGKLHAGIVVTGLHDPSPFESHSYTARPPAAPSG